MSIKLPVLGFCNGSLRLFPEVHDAELYIEPIDVENDEWEVFDASGRSLGVSVQKRPTRGLWRFFSAYEETVSITELVAEEANTDRLRALILSYLSKLAQADPEAPVPCPEQAADLPADQLIARIIEATSRG